MSTNLSTPPPKARGRHQHSKSATPTTYIQYDNNNGASTKSHQRRPRGNRNNDQHTANANANLPLYPADQLAGYPIDLAQPVGAVDYRNGHSADDAVASDSLPSTKPKGRRPRQRRNNQDGAVSPGKNADNTRTSHDLAVQTPAKKQTAYAGPTFHASPAPSALPVPKFFSKSVPSATHPGSLQARLDDESSDSSSSPPPKNDAAAAPEVVAEESPLDFFFKADREEKALKSGGLLTPGKLDRVDSHNSASNGGHHSRHASNGSPRGMFPLELDSNSIPSNTRENGQAKFPEKRSATRSVTAPVVPQTNMKEHDDVSQKLKDMLFSIPSPATTVPSPPGEHSHLPSEPNSRFHTPSPFYRPNSVPNSAPAMTSTAAAPAGNGPLHYGNRNLSPLFKAAKNESVKRTSNLRQEVNHFNTEPFRQPDFGAPPAGPPHQDVSTISRNFLNLHIQSQATPLGKSFQQYPANVGATSELPANNANFFQYHASSVTGTPNINNGVPSSIAASSMQSRNAGFVSSAQPVDVQSMENDLRRILNLNVVGSGVR